MNATTSVGRGTAARLESKISFAIRATVWISASRIFHCSGTKKSVSLWSSRWNSATERLKLLSELHHKCLSAVAGAAAAGNASQTYGIFVINGQLFAQPDLPPAAEKQVARGPFWLQVGLAAMVDILRAASPNSSVNYIAAFQISDINRFFKWNSRRLCPAHPFAGVRNHYPAGRNILQGIHTKAVNSGKCRPQTIACIF